MPEKRRRFTTEVRVMSRKGRDTWLFRWRTINGDWRERQSKVPLSAGRDAAVKAAAKLERELKRKRKRKIPRLDWREFWRRYEVLKLKALSEKHQKQWVTARNTVTRIIDPTYLDQINDDSLDELVIKLREESRSEATIAAYLRQVKAALRFAVSRKWLPKSRMPTIEMPKGAARKKRSRDITFEQFEFILSLAPEVRPHDHADWEAVLWALWLSGFRISEIHAIHWEEGDVTIDLSRQFPGFVFWKQKNCKEQWVPMTPEFHQRFVASSDVRTGFLFALPGRYGKRVTAHTCNEVVNAIGKKSGIRTGGTKEKPKYATSSDIGRRAFATRYRGVLSQWDLAELMRHGSPDTTAVYYAGQREEQLAALLWGNQKPA